MIALLRHLLSILLLPFVVVAVVPYGLQRSDIARTLRWDASPDVAWLVYAAGAGAFLAGLALFAWCVVLFARVGRGTLAPWDPTRRLVATGPYRHVRNPMITGVALMLTGEVLLWRSGALALWLCAFVLINHTYFLRSEEPGMEKRFGDDFRIYRANVPRWIPRLRPWTGLDRP